MLCARRDRTTRSPEPNPGAGLLKRINGEVCSRALRGLPAGVYGAYPYPGEISALLAENIKVRGAHGSAVRKNLCGDA